MALWKGPCALFGLFVDQKEERLIFSLFIFIIFFQNFEVSVTASINSNALMKCMDLDDDDILMSIMRILLVVGFFNEFFYYGVSLEKLDWRNWIDDDDQRFFFSLLLSLLFSFMFSLFHDFFIIFLPFYLFFLFFPLTFSSFKLKYENMKKMKMMAVEENEHGVVKLAKNSFWEKIKEKDNGDLQWKE